MVATRCPAFISATTICIATVVLPEPPFSFPTTITCGEVGNSMGACNMARLFDGRRYVRFVLRISVGGSVPSPVELTTRSVGQLFLQAAPVTNGGTQEAHF